MLRNNVQLLLTVQLNDWFAGNYKFKPAVEENILDSSYNSNFTCFNEVPTPWDSSATQMKLHQAKVRVAVF